jgi:hypothetical protein
LDLNIKETGFGYLPTPINSMVTIGDFNQAKFHSSKRPEYKDVNQVIYSTPRSSDSHGASKNRIKGALGENDKRHQLREEVYKSSDNQKTGQLNPDWVEWLMGWLIGWSDLEPLKELLWLDPAVDPADIESDRTWQTYAPGTHSRGMYPLKKNVNALFNGERTTVQVLTVDEVMMEELKKPSTGTIPRITTIKKNRINRLKAIGNGQVPLCAATAFKLLMESI